MNLKQQCSLFPHKYSCVGEDSQIQMCSKPVAHKVQLTDLQNRHDSGTYSSENLCKLHEAVT